MDNLKETMRDVLENNILSYWLTKVKDEENGGFYGRIDGNDQVHPVAEKGAVMNARILWAFSAAYRVLKKPEYLEAATRAKDYVRDYFLDREYGGIYWSVDYQGNPLDTKKQTYAIGFAIYGSRSMPVQQVTRRRWISPSPCIMTSRSMPLMPRTTDISRH